MAGTDPYYAIQPAFTGGEISSDVASRVDLDKYQLSLLQAKNAVIRPYGAVRKRPGFLYCGGTRNSYQNVILQRFEYTAEINYLLEFGPAYIQIWRDGKKLDIYHTNTSGAIIDRTLTTPYTAADLPKLRFVQSNDVMFICSGKYPVKALGRLSDTSWSFEDVEWDMMPFEDVNPNEEATISVSASSGTGITLASGWSVFGGRTGSVLKLEQYVSGETVSVQCSKDKGLAKPSSTIYAGKNWKIITHGTWTGSVTVYQRKDGQTTWKELRKYTSKDDYNPTESGDVDEPCELYMMVNLTSGECNADLSTYPFHNTGYVKITSVTATSGAYTTATGDVIKGRLGATGAAGATADWYWQAWNDTNGYPYCAAFFQDRLCFGGSAKYPQRVWMSKSGDYYNFGVDKESGTVTDDSAVTADLLSLKFTRINHMDVGNDLMIFTDGSAWTISGNETVTPSNITPRNQENYGTNDVKPIRVGGRVVYVQRRGSIVRDIGYSYDVDSYVGVDLTILAKHLIRNHTISDSAYAQEPDSVLYFVRDDGKLLCLTYMTEQKVYGWSVFETDGTIKAVETVANGNNDEVYIVVERYLYNKGYVQSIERLDLDHSTSGSQQDYTMLDHASTISRSSSQGATQFANGRARCMVDGYLLDGLVDFDSNGFPQLPSGFSGWSTAIVGLPYTMTLEQCNVDFGMTASGTVQGRKKNVTSVILRLDNSFGGKVGPDEKHLNEIIYDPHRLETGDNVLYSGDIRVTLAAGGFNDRGRTVIVHDTPYPFSLSAIIRLVTFGG